jgi:hypothetical protein
MNRNNHVDKSDGKLFKNWGSRSLYSDFVPQFKYTYNNIYIMEDGKRTFHQISPTPTSNIRILTILSLNTSFLRRAWYS